MTDLRIRRTEANIQRAFIQLVNQVGFKHVTVKSIADTALINRQTFYKHYEDKYQLADEMIDDFVAIYDQELEKRLVLKAQNVSFEESFGILFPEVQQLVAHRFDTLNALLTIQTDQPSLEKKLQQVMIQHFNQFLPEEMTAFEKVIISSLLVNLFDYFVTHKQLPELADVKKTLTDFLLLLK